MPPVKAAWCETRSHIVYSMSDIEKTRSHIVRTNGHIKFLVRLQLGLRFIMRPLMWLR